MEIIKELCSFITSELKGVRQLNDAFIGLNRRIAKEVEYTGRLDKVARIDALKSRLVGEVNRVKHEEDISERGFNASKSFNSIAGFALGSIVGATAKQNLLMLGFKSFSNELDKEAEFVNVMVAIKENNTYFSPCQGS